MGTETERQSSGIQTTVTTPSSTASASGPKMSIFARKSGFVIPKNKLSGSMVPLFRGTNKGDGDSVNEESTNQVQRKTKWGPDLTLDTTVRKGRALAYQTRVNQISEQLNLGALAIEDNQDSISTIEIHSGKSSDNQHSNEKLEKLELERREIIGEILKLNPSYKAPSDYKPLLKEAKVPIPIKEYNFVGLVFGPASDTQKRLEKETGAKIRVYGSKADTGGKVEVLPTDVREIDGAYDDLYVHVSADTFEKIDAAVALIELLITPVSVNAVSSTTTSAAVFAGNVESHASQGTPSSIAPPLVNQEIAQPYAGHLQPPQSHFAQYPQTWFSVDPAQAPMYPQSGTSAPLLSNPVQVSSLPFGSLSIPSLSAPRPVIAPSFSPISQNFSPVPPRPQPSYMQLAPQPVGPRNSPIALTRPPNDSRSAFPDNILPAAGESARWLQSPVSTTASQGPNNALPIMPPVQSHGVNMASQNVPAASQPAPGASSHFPPAPSGSMPSANGPMQPTMPQVNIRGPSPDVTFGRPPMPFLMAPPLSQPGNAPSMKPPTSISRPQHPNSGDFTFQPHRPSNAPSHMGWQSSQRPHHNIQTGQAPLAPQPSPIRPQMHNMNPSAHGFPGPQMNQPLAQMSQNFLGSPTIPLAPPRHPALQGQGHDAFISPNIPHMQPRNIFPPHNGPFPPRPGNQMHLQQNHHSGRFPTPLQHFGNRPGNPFGGQIYDPFSPTAAAPFNPRIGGNVAKVQNESDPEYDDLMASVGVK